jgi:hypothetical protein
MKQSLTIYNESIDKTITIGKTAPYLLQTFDGAGGLGTEIQEQKSNNQDGSYRFGATFQKRFITFTIMIMATTFESLLEKRREIQNVFNPKQELLLTYSNDTQEKEIKGYSEFSPRFSQEKGNYYQQALISFVCYDPFWEDILESSEFLSFNIPNFMFDLELTDEFEFETDGINAGKLYNDGDVATPVQIIFSGPASNPKIENLTTGEYIKVNKVLLEGQRLLIDTSFGKKSVQFDDGAGNITSAFNLIDINSSFFSLATGENTIKYTADAGVDVASLYIQYKNRYIGI